MSMEDILKVLVESRQPGGNSSQQGADPMTSLIGGLIGGAQQQSGGSQQAADVANLIGGILGGVQQAQAASGQQQTIGLGQMMGALEAVMGGQSTGANDPVMALLQPFIAPLAKKANISPELATIVISFLVHKLLAHHPTSGRDSSSFNLDDMLNQMSTGKVDTSLLHNSGMIRELSQKTGMNEQATEAALQAAIPLIGNTVSKFVKPSGAAHAPAKPSSAGTQAKAVKKPAAKK